MITAQPAIESTAIEKIAVCGDSCSLLRVSRTGVVTDLVTGAYRSLGIVRSLQALQHSAAGPYKDRPLVTRCGRRDHRVGKPLIRVGFYELASCTR